MLFNADCMDIMPDYDDDHFDLAIVDPPYGIGMDVIYKTGLHKTIHKKKQWNNAIPDAEYFTELYRVSKHQIIWGCNYFGPYIKDVGRIVHDKQMNQENTKLRFSEADIASCSMQKRITMFRYTWAGNNQGGHINWHNDGIDGRIHPTQKPVKLYEWILNKYAKVEQKILDTHLGSGSIAIACHYFGCDLTGIEIDTEYFNAAKKRINEHTKQISFI
tara:strand:+ start:20 stop:670 length:651 start_codon:yes stop_codon:yes gene_type:complete